MSVEAITRLRCDDARSRDCLRTFEAVAGVNLTRKFAFMAGWRHRRGITADICPACDLASQR